MREWLSILKSPTVIAVFILELAERTAYYGTVFSLSTYATLLLRIDTGGAFIITNTVFALSPLSAFIGGILADTWFHRVEILIAASMCYALGIGILALSALPSFFGTGDFAEPTIAPFLLFCPGLIFLSVGYGAFKVCTSPLVAEGVLSLAKHELKFVVSGVNDSAQLAEEKNKQQESATEHNTNGVIIPSSYTNEVEDESRKRLIQKKQYKLEEKEQNFVRDDDASSSDDDSSSTASDAIGGEWQEDMIVEEDNVDVYESEDHHIRNGNDDENDENEGTNHNEIPPHQGGHSHRAINKSSSSPTTATTRQEEQEQEKTKNKKKKKKKRIEADKETLLAFTYSVYAAVINLGSLIGFTFIPSLRMLGDIEFMTGTSAEDGKMRPAGFIYSWGACFGVSVLSLLIFFMFAKFSRRFVRPKGFASSLIYPSKNNDNNQQSSATLPDDDASQHHHDDTTATQSSSSASRKTHTESHHQHDQRKMDHPMEYVANLGEAVGLTFLVNCCCEKYSSAYIYRKNKKNKADQDCAADSSSADDRTSTVLEAGLLAEVEEEEDEEAARVKKHVGSLVAVLKIFFMLPIYWFTLSLCSSAFQVQALCTILPDWLTVDMLNSVNTITFLLFLPIVQIATSKLLIRLHKTGGLFFGFFQSVLVLRLFLGFIVAAIAMVIAGFLQIKIDSVATLTEDGDCILHDQNAVASEVLPGPFAITFIFLGGVGTALCDPAALEAAFELAPADMRSTVMSLYLLESSLSGFVGLGLSPAFADPSTYLASFFSLGAAMVVMSVLWAIWVRNVHKQTAPRALVAAAYNAENNKHNNKTHHHRSNNTNDDEQEQQRQALLAEA